MYDHCRSRLLALGCDADTSSMFQQLNKDDLNASTAIVNPNVPGSANVLLSWIWHHVHAQTGVNVTAAVDPNANANADTSQFWECKSILWPFIVIGLTIL
jgi:hypothetical protein